MLFDITASLNRPYYYYSLDWSVAGRSAAHDATVPFAAKIGTFTGELAAVCVAERPLSPTHITVGAGTAPHYLPSEVAYFSSVNHDFVEVQIDSNLLADLAG